MTKGDMTKAIYVRINEDQQQKLAALGDQLKNTDAGVLRFALDLLWKTVIAKGGVPAEIEPSKLGEEA